MLILFVLPILLCAYVGGVRLGLLATAVAVLGGDYFLIEPKFNFFPTNQADVVGLTILTVIGVLLSLLMELLLHARHGSDRALAEYKRAEAAGTLLAAIVESSFDAIIGKDLEGIVTSWNAGAERMFGYTAEEMLGQSVSLLIPPDRKDDEAQILDRIKQGGRMEHFETVRRRKDGKLIDVSVTVSPIKDDTGKVIGASKVARDITQQKQAKEELINNRAQLQAIFDNMTEAVMVMDRNCQFVHLNPLAASLHGLIDPVTTMEELVERVEGVSLTGELILPEEWPLMRALRGDFVHDYEMGVRRKDNGRVIFAACNASPVRNEAGEPTRIILTFRDTTGSKLAEEALQESDERLRTVTDTAQVGLVMVDKEHRYRYANRAYATMLHLPTEDIVGEKVADVLPAVYETQILPRLERAFTGERVEYTLTVPAAGVEKSRHYAVTYQQGMDRSEAMVVVVIVDITERKEAAQAMADSEERFRTLANSIPQLAWIARADGHIFWYNKRWYEYTGATPEQMEGWGWQSVHDPDVLPIVMDGWKGAIDSGKPFEMEFPLRGADGKFRAFLTRVEPMKDPEGRLVQWFGTNTDVEVLKQAKEKIRNVNIELEQRVVERTGQLEEANKELEAFSYSVSHDLRAPLRAMNGFAGMLIKDLGNQVPVESARHLERIRVNALKMGELIDDLLSFSRLSRQSLKHQEVDMTRLVQNVLDDLAPEREGREIEIKTGTLPGCRGDPALLKQVWVNLLSNATKYTRGRERAVVETGCETANGETVYFVRDNGAGFDMRYVDKLFGVFQRLHRAEDFEGTGVGLAIVQRVVHRHGGRVWAEAEKDKGAVFRFTLEKGNKNE